MRKNGELKNSPFNLKVMQTLQIEFDETLLAQVDETTKILQKNRTELIEEAVRDFLKKQRSEELDRRLVESYTRIPQQPEEYEIWQDEQVWVDE